MIVVADHTGGVSVSYLEWAQNIQQFRWDEERVNQELDKKMRRAYRSVRETADQHGIDLVLRTVPATGTVYADCAERTAPPGLAGRCP